MPELIYIVIALILGALFAGSETGFVSVNKLKMQYLANNGDKKAGRVLKFINNPDKFLALTLIGTNISHVIASTFSALWLKNSLLATLILTPILLIFSEIIPKSVFREKANKITVALFYPMMIFYYLLYPLIKIVMFTTKAIFMMLKLKGLPQNGVFTRQDLETVVNEAKYEIEETSESTELISEVFSLNSTIAGEIMTPRPDIVAIENTASVEEALSLMEKSSYSRLPIYDDNLDNIIGMVYIFDLFESDNNELVTKYMRELPFIPESVKCDKLLRKFNEWQSQMAIVVDEFGGTAGLITTEDVLEELFGEIKDEYDKEESEISKLSENFYRIDAGMEIDRINKKLKTDFPEDGDYETIAGFFIDLYGDIPSPGEKVSYNNYDLTVESASGKKIKVILLKINNFEIEQEDDNSEGIF